MAMINGRVTSTDGTAFVYEVLTTGVAAGGVVTASGDGLALYSAAGNILTGSGSGAGGLGNDKAWFTFQWDTEQWTFRRSTSQDLWRIAVSPAGLFAGGSATVTQSAPDEFVLVGAGTAAAPTSSSLFSTDGATLKGGIGVDDAAPRRMFCVTWVSATGAPRTVFFRDIVTPPEPGDANPVTRGWARASGTLSVNVWGSTSGGSTTGSYYPAFPPSASAPVTGTQVSTPLSTYGYIGTGLSAFPGNAGVLSISGADPLVAPFYGRWSADGSPQLKGYSTLFLTDGQTRTAGDTVSVGTPLSRLYFLGQTVPWDGAPP